MCHLNILDLQLFPSANPSPHKWVMKSPRTIYPSFPYIPSCLWWTLYIWLIEHIKNRFCLSTAPIIWTFICGSGDCRQWEAFLSYTLYFIPCSKLQHLIFVLNTTLELSVAFHPRNWFMADSPLLCLFMKNFVSLLRMWFFIYPIYLKIVRRNWEFLPVCKRADQIALPTKSRRLNWAASAQLAQCGGGCSIPCYQP